MVFVFSFVFGFIARVDVEYGDRVLIFIGCFEMLLNDFENCKVFPPRPETTPYSNVLFDPLSSRQVPPPPPLRVCPYASMGMGVWLFLY